MRLMRLFLFFALLFIFSCSSKQEIPADILSRPKMQAIMLDMLRADEFVLNFERKDSTRSAKDKSTLLYEEVFRIHQTSKSQFQKSIKFYSQHPDLFKPVLDSMEKLKPAIISESYKAHRADSLHTNKPALLPANRLRDSIRSKTPAPAAPKK